MFKKTGLLTIILVGTLLIPQTTQPIINPELIALEVLLRSAPEILKWLNKEEHKCPVHPLQHHQPCPLVYFKILTTASETHIANLKKLHAMDPENSELLNLIGQGLSVQKKFQLRLQETAELSETQREAYRLTQERNFTEDDLKILAILKERGYKDVPQEVLWQAKRDRYTELSPGIFYSKDFLQQHEHPQMKRPNP